MSGSAKLAADFRGSSSATWALAFICVVLRFVARRNSKAGFWYDDWLIIPALIGGIGLWYASAILAVNHGLIRPHNATDKDLLLRNKGLYIVEILWTASLTFAKLSILLLYLRLFRQRRVPRWIIQSLLGAVIPWGVVLFFVTIFQCKPLYSIWVPRASGTCPIDNHKLALWGTITHIVTDILILVTPIPMIWALQLGLAQKWMLSGIFGLGTFTTVVSGIRFHYLIQLIASGHLMPAIQLVIWKNVEVGTSVICACLPCLRPIGSLLVDKFRALRESMRSARHGKDLLVDILPRRKQGRDMTPIISPHELPETTTVKSRDFNPKELDALKERPILEMAATERGPLELESGVAASELRTYQGRHSVIEVGANTSSTL